jgi:tetratricopeptide (TPR) repeat protein
MVFLYVIRKYLREIIMHWITISGIVLIAAGTFLAYFGHNIRNKFDDKHLHQSISNKTSQIDELISGNNELLTRIDEYQKIQSEKDEIIKQLEAQSGELSVSIQEQLTDEQVESRADEPDVPAREHPADEQIEAGDRVIPEQDVNDVIAQARSLCNEGEYDEAYKIADDLRQKNPDIGLAYYILGTVEMRRKNFDEGEYLLNRAVQLGLPDEDMAWAFHNLGISLVRKQDFERAKGLLEKAVELNPDMEKSSNALKLLDDYLQKKHTIEQVKSLYNEGKFDEAYKIADDLRQRRPDFGLAYFILGTIEMSRENYDKGGELLNKAIQLGLPDEDMAWAFHNLGISSLRRKDMEKAREFLNKAVELNPDMEESRKTLDTLDDVK